jgi:hypothetical protein
MSLFPRIALTARARRFARQALSQSLGWLIIVGSLALTASACSDSTAAGAAPLSVSFSASTPGTASTAPSAQAAVGDIVLTIGGHTLDLTQVQLTVDRVKLDGIRGANCRADDDDFDDEDEFDDNDDFDDDDHDECEEVRLGPTTVDLPLAGGVVTLDQSAIPAGATIRKAEIRISQVRLRGTFDGQAFDTFVPVQLERDLKFSPPVVVAAGSPVALTVNLAVATWLINTNGTLIDPRLLSTNSTLRSLVRSRISNSFRIFEDRDRDGREDGDRDGRG